MPLKNRLISPHPLALLPLPLLDPVPLALLLQHPMRQIRHGLQHGLLGAALRHGLVDGMMSEKQARAFTQDMRMLVYPGVPHCVVAGDFHNLGAGGVVVPPDVLGEGFLLVRPVLLPLAATRVLFFERAFFPSGEHFERIGERLRDYDARVEGEFAFAVVGGVFVAVEDLPCVERHRDGGRGRDAPAVEEPFDGELEVLDCGVGVDEDDELVGFEEFG